MQKKQSIHRSAGELAMAFLQHPTECAENALAAGTASRNTKHTYGHARKQRQLGLYRRIKPKFRNVRHWLAINFFAERVGLVNS